jgi:hypothetical protein
LEDIEMGLSHNDGDIVVVGAGITGLIFCFYNPQAVLIKDSSVRAENPFVFIQENRYTRKLLKDLGIPAPVVGVKINNNLSASRIVRDKLGNENFSTEYVGTDRISNVGKDNILRVYDISEKCLCEMLESRITNQTYNSKAVRVLSENHTVELETGAVVEYSKLVSTVHFSIFENLCPNWEIGTGIFPKDLFFSIQPREDIRSSYISYLSDEDSPIIKVVANKASGAVGTEYNGEHRNFAMNSFIVRASEARFVGNANPPPEGVTFSGRFATANPHWRIEDSIYLSSEGLFLSEMLDEQKRFDSILKNKTGVKGEDRIQRLILHAHSELSELLRETNWKMNVACSRRINATSILEEGIDIIKLILAVLLEYNYTPREIIEKFWHKSQINWEKFLGEFYGGV